MKRLDVRSFAHRVARGRLALRIALCFALGTGAGEFIACVRPLTVLRREPASDARLGAHTTWLLQPIDFSSVVVGYVPEPAWLANRSFAQRASWERDKLALSQLFAAHLLRNAGALRLEPGGAPGAPDAVVILPRVTYIEPGTFWTGPELYRDTEVHMTVTIVNTDGQLLETLALRATVHPGYSARASIGGRVRAAAHQLGGLLLQYLRDRCRTA